LAARLYTGGLATLPLPNRYFDEAIAFNSIYHGTGGEVRTAVTELARRLRPGGTLLATFPSRASLFYGRGIEMAPHTFGGTALFESILGSSGEAGVPHYFADEADLKDMLGMFKIDECVHEEFRLPSVRDGAVVWTQVRRAYFWRVIATRLEEEACQPTNSC